MASLPLLGLRTVTSPCTRDWQSMQGDDRVRHCTECNKNVYDLSAMTREEAARLISDREGKLCGRLFRRADGTLVTADCTDEEGTVKLTMLGEIAVPEAQALLSDDERISRDTVLAELARTLTHSRPADAERIVALVERAVLATTGDAYCCPWCTEPIALAKSMSAGDDSSADPVRLLSVVTESLERAHGARGMLLARELRRRPLLDSDWMTCPH